MKNLAEMTDEQIIEVLAEYKSKVEAGVIDFTDPTDVSTEEVVFGSVALEYLEISNPEAYTQVSDLYKYFQTEMLSRAGQMPLK
jgi:hypothetical protein